MTVLYLIRHAECEANINMVFSGHTDCDVTENGEIQLKQLAERFKNIELDAVYSSPLIRTLKTAKAVNLYHNLPIIKNKDIIEINGGGFEGKLWGDIPGLYPAEYDLWKNNQSLFAIQDGESMQNVYDRMKKAVLDIVLDNKGKTIAVVSHGCAIRNFLCFVLNKQFAEIDSVEWCENTGVSKICFNEDNEPQVEYINDDSHLSKEMLTLGNQVWWR